MKATALFLALLALAVPSAAADFGGRDAGPPCADRPVGGPPGPAGWVELSPPRCAVVDRPSDAAPAPEWLAACQRDRATPTVRFGWTHCLLLDHHAADRVRTRELIRPAD